MIVAALCGFFVGLAVGLGLCMVLVSCIVREESVDGGGE